LPPSASIVQSERTADDDLVHKAFDGHEIKHAVLEKIRQLRRDDVKHGLGEVQSLFDDEKDNTFLEAERVMCRSEIARRLNLPVLRAINPPASSSVRYSLAAFLY
jgi:hypothetical protein